MDDSDATLDRQRAKNLKHDIKRIRLQPGEILWVKIQPPDGLRTDKLQEWLATCKETVTGALDEAMAQAGHSEPRPRIPVLLTTYHQVDFQAINIVDFLSIIPSTEGDV